MVILVAFILGVIATAARWASIMTFFAAVGVWASQFLATPMFENREALTGELFALFGWSLLTYIITAIILIALAVAAGLRVRMFGIEVN